MQICVQQPSGPKWGNQLLSQQARRLNPFQLIFYIIWSRTQSVENTVFIIHQLYLFCHSTAASELWAPGLGTRAASPPRPPRRGPGGPPPPSQLGCERRRAALARERPGGGCGAPPRASCGLLPGRPRAPPVPSGAESPPLALSRGTPGAWYPGTCSRRGAGRYLGSCAGPGRPAGSPPRPERSQGPGGA